MTLRDIQDQLAAMRLHPLTDTNLEAVERDGGSVRFCVDVSELRDELEEAKDDLERANKAASDDAARADGAEERADKAEALLAEFKDSGGSSLLEYVKRVEEAEFQAREQMKIALDAQRQLDALRKRKGRGAVIIKHADDVFRILRHVANGPECPESELARKLWEAAK